MPTHPLTRGGQETARRTPNPRTTTHPAVTVLSRRTGPGRVSFREEPVPALYVGFLSVRRRATAAPDPSLPKGLLRSNR